MPTKYLIATALAAAIVLTLWWQWDRPGDFEQEVVRAALTEEIRQDGSRCPLSDRAVRDAPDWVLSACAAGGLAWHEAARRYGDDAAKVFLVFGRNDAFAQAFDRLGHPVVPVVAYFVRHGSAQYLLEQSVGQSLSRLWADGQLGFSLADLTPEQYGLIAIHELNRRGHEMLSEFEIVDGIAVRKPLTRALFGAKDILLGGMTDLEAVIARGERLPTWSEVGWAALDVAVVAGGIGAASKALRAARVPAAVAGRGAAKLSYLKAAGRGAVRSLATVGKAAGLGAVVALPYVAITRPHLVAGAAGWLAEQARLPAWLGVFAAYAALCLAAAILARIVLGPFLWLLRLLYRTMRAAGALGRRSIVAARVEAPVRATI